MTTITVKHESELPRVEATPMTRTLLAQTAEPFDAALDRLAETLGQPRAVSSQLRQGNLPEFVVGLHDADDALNETRNRLFGLRDAVTSTAAITPEGLRLVQYTQQYLDVREARVKIAAMTEREAREGLDLWRQFHGDKPCSHQKHSYMGPLLEARVAEFDRGAAERR